jgi:four helix bundle protein
MVLAKSVYQITKALPAEERFGLVAQMRRAAVSIPSNIAEGQPRHSTGEFIHSIHFTRGRLVGGTGDSVAAEH